MKKLCILLALALILSALPALAAQGDMTLEPEEGSTAYFNGGFALEDTLYLATNDSLYTWRVGDAALTKHEYVLPPAEAWVSRDVYPFCCQGELYAIVLSTISGESTIFEGAELCALSLLEDGTFGVEELRSIDWEDLVEYIGQNSYATHPQAITSVGDSVFLCHYDSGYNTVVSALDMETGRLEQIDALENAWMITPYKDGLLLAELFDYTEPDEVRLEAYDPEDDSAWTLATLSVPEYSAPTGLAYDAETDTVYCVKGGEICPVDLDAEEIGEGVTDMPLAGYGNSAGCVLEGGYYALCAGGAVVRSLAPGDAPSVRLKVCDISYSESVDAAYSRFAQARDDVGVVLSREYSETQDMVTTMMNQDEGVDIYTLWTSDASYSALFERGYMLELEGAAVDALAGRMYPSLRDALSRDGRLVAIPVTVNCVEPGVDERALERLGLTLDDVPDNWWDFLEFLKSLEGPISQDDGVRAFSQGTTDVQARNELIFTVFNSYQNYVNTVDPNMGYNTELLRGLLERIEALDYVALGCEEDFGDDRPGIYRYDPNDPVLDLFRPMTSCAIGGYGDVTPIHMGLDADTRAPLALEMVTAFVNPFTEHPEEALAFMEMLADSLAPGTLYNLTPELNEPIRGRWNEEYLAEARKDMEALQAQLEQAEPAQAQQLQDSIDERAQNLETLEKYAWDASPESIAWYRANAEGVVPAPVNWLYAGEEGEAADLLFQYIQGEAGVDETLRAIDRKVQMMMMEGN